MAINWNGYSPRIREPRAAFTDEPDDDAALIVIDTGDVWLGRKMCVRNVLSDKSPSLISSTNTTPVFSSKSRGSGINILVYSEQVTRENQFSVCSFVVRVCLCVYTHAWQDFFFCWHSGDPRPVASVVVHIERTSLLGPGERKEGQMIHMRKKRKMREKKDETMSQLRTLSLLLLHGSPWNWSTGKTVSSRAQETCTDANFTSFYPMTNKKKVSHKLLQIRSLSLSLSLLLLRVCESVCLQKFSSSPQK